MEQIQTNNTATAEKRFNKVTLFGKFTVVLNVQII